MKNNISIFLLLIVSQLSFCQEKDTLLTIDGNSIGTDEFLRIYNKNSSIAEENQKSIDDYLDLFINYKLKVIEAESLGYDTMKTFTKEMAGYTKQLAKPYLENNEALDSFIIEAYNRSTEEINASHILLRLDKNATPKQVDSVYKEIMRLRSEIISGKSFQQVIDENSPNPNDKIGGDLGWFSVFRMVYPFETGAYNTPVGEVSMPVRTEYGYHLILVNDRRPFRGEVMVAHIMTLLPKNATDLDKEAAWQKIQKAYAELEAGADWNETVEKYSEHKASIRKGGNVGWLHTGNAPEEILDIAFALDTGTYSKPFQTDYGYHIVKPLEFKSNPTFEEAKPEIEKKIRSTTDITTITRNQLLDRIKPEYGFNVYEDRMEPIYKLADSTMYLGTWNPDVAKNLVDTVFYIGDKVYTQYDIAKEIAKKRIISRNTSLENQIWSKVKKFIDDEIIAYEEGQLPEKYPEYKYLLQEYHDGILLFNLTEDKVWHKAIEDSIGLENFYNSLPEKYKWEKRIAMTKYTYSDSALFSPLMKAAKNRAKKGLDATAVSKVICPMDSLPCISFTELKYERGDNAVADSIAWVKGSYLTTRDGDKYILYYVDAVLPEQEKGLSDARGLYTADYQSYLEKQWIDELRSKYAIEVNEDTLNKLKEQQGQK
jgi:peptidyl-prolyl cis-trans isomerase SurA